jgi:hypothetical protein
VRKEDVIDICRRIPEKDQTKIQFILVNGMQLNVDTFARFEPTYMVFRGREGGQTDEGRGFFVAYDDVVTVKLERVVKASELKGFYGEIVAQEIDLATAKFEDSNAAKTPLPASISTPKPNAGPMDPAQIAKANLLARIRAARTAAGVGTS